MTLKSVEEVVDNLFPQGTEHYWLPEKISDVITRDRQAFATALVTALEGISGSQAVLNPNPLSLGDVMISKDQAITIVKELLTPTV